MTAMNLDRLIKLMKKAAERERRVGPSIKTYRRGPLCRLPVARGRSFKG
jgi:hypothetical protein